MKGGRTGGGRGCGREGAGVSREAVMARVRSRTHKGHRPFADRLS